MAGKDNWRGFLDAIYSKWRLFLPILSPPLRSATASPAAPSSPSPHLLASSHLSSPSFLPFFPFFFRFHLIFRREIWINFSCVAEGTTFCELQILANTAIYLKWQIRRSNLPESRRFFELSSFERVCVRSRRRGKSPGKRWLRDFNVKYNSAKRDGLRLESLLCLNVEGTVGKRFKPTASRQSLHAFAVAPNKNPGLFYLLTFFPRPIRATSSQERAAH